MIKMKILVLGLGNLLLADEGVGVHAAHSLLEDGCPDHVEVMDIGTAVLDALPALEEAERVVVIDAVKGGHPPGTIYRMPIEAFESAKCIPSMHGFDITRVLSLTQRNTPPEVTVLGVEPATIDWSLELSPQVRATFPDLMRTLRDEIGEGGRFKDHRSSGRGVHPSRALSPCGKSYGRG